MAAPTNTDFTTAIDLGAITATPDTATPTVQTVSDSGTTYTVYYSFTVPDDAVEIGAFAFGDLTTYMPRARLYLGPASAPVEVANGAIDPLNVPGQYPVTGGEQYFLKITPNAGNPAPAVLTLTVYVAPNTSVPVGSIAVNDDGNEFMPLALLSSTSDYVVKKFIPTFPSGENGDTLVDGTVLVEDGNFSRVVLFNSAYQQLSTHAFTQTRKIRTCLGANLFYIGLNKNPVDVYTMTGDGTLAGPETLTAMTSCNALAAANDQSVLYHVFTGNNQPIRVWNLVTHTAAANLAAGIANYQTLDILVLSTNSIVVGYYKSTVTRDYQVKRYDAAGTTLNTYTFDLPSGETAPRLAYAIDNPTSFWVYMHPAATPGQAKFLNIKASDGTVLTTRLHEEFEAGAYVGTATATPTAFFGPSFSCTFWITRVAASPVTQTFPIRRQRRFLLPSSDDNKNMQIPIIELLMRTGIGLKPDAWGSDADEPLGANPEVRIRLSKDGGETWGPERILSAGLRGRFKNRVRILQATGNYRNAVLEVTVDAPVDFQFLAAMGDPIEGSS